jgi:hypothetical protein
MLNLVDKCLRHDAAVALCCPAGVLGLKRYLPDGFKVIPAMKVVGVFQVLRVLEESGDLVYIDRDRSVTIRMLGK